MSAQLDRYSRLRFSIGHAAAYAAAVAITLGLASPFFLVAMLLAPLLVGCVVGHAECSDKHGLLAGGMAAAFWAGLLIIGPLLLLLYAIPNPARTAMNDGALTPEKSVILFVNIAVCSLAGFLGGRVAKH